MLKTQLFWKNFEIQFNFLSSKTSNRIRYQSELPLVFDIIHIIQEVEQF